MEVGRKGHVAATGVEAKATGRRWVCEDLQRSGTGQGGVACGCGGEEFVAAEVESDELISGDEAHAVGAGSEGFAADLDGELGDEVGLVGVLDGGGVAGGVDGGSEEELISILCGELESCGVAGLNAGGPATVEDGCGHDGAGLIAGEEGGAGGLSRSGAVRMRTGDNSRKRRERVRRVRVVIVWL